MVKSVFGENHFLSTWSVPSVETAQCRPLQVAAPMFLPPTPDPRPPMPCSSFLQGAVHLVSLNLSP